jgi:hypothetical protein
MLDVHAPHESPHSWRDFATHLVIVTIGLFIALMMEAGVEWLHHRHVVAEARANIRQEIEDDHIAAQHDLVMLQKNVQLERTNIKNIRGLQADPKHFHGTVNNTMSFDSMDDAAWRTARDTGALAYMPYAEVQRYSDLYMLEGLVNTRAISTGENDFLANAPFEMGLDPDQLPADEYPRMVRDNANVVVELVTLKQFVQQFDELCIDDLKQ